MVARNFSLQDLPFSRLLSVPDEDERSEFLTLEELKPHHLTDLGAQQPTDQTISQQQHLADDFNPHLPLDHGIPDQEYNVYYDLNSHQNK